MPIDLLSVHPSSIYHSNLPVMSETWRISLFIFIDIIDTKTNSALRNKLNLRPKLISPLFLIIYTHSCKYISTISKYFFIVKIKKKVSKFFPIKILQLFGIRALLLMRSYDLRTVHDNSARNGLFSRLTNAHQSVLSKINFYVFRRIN